MTPQFLPLTIIWVKKEEKEAEWDARKCLCRGGKE